MPAFVQSLRISAPVEAVFAFHQRPDALQLLSPAFPPVRILHKEGGIEAGSRVELKIGPFRWVALHTAFEKNQFFEDQQVSGPFAGWVHRHEFKAEGQGTILTDRIVFQLPGGAWANRLFGWAVQIGLRQMFRHRHRVTKKYCEEQLAGRRFCLAPGPGCRRLRPH
jgi:ligand-binding SRPBCC domain-containing protein